MLTKENLATLVAAAGADFAWAGARSSRPTNKPERPIRAGLTAFLRDYAGARCVFCGDAAEVGQVAHIVASGDRRGQGGADTRNGFLPGNLGWSCLDCNEIDRVSGNVVEFDSIVHPELIPAMWPDNSELARLGILEKEKADARREEKKRKRGM